MINRLLSSKLTSLLNKGKVIIILGARQTGKTTLLKSLNYSTEPILWLNGDEADTQSIFENPTSKKLKAFIGNHKIVIIDEAQRIKNIGLCIKLIKDNYDDIQTIATGSSAFELANKINEPLTGRKWELQLFPISFEEMVNHHGLLNEKRLLEHRLVYGYYPEVVNANGDEKNILKSLSDSYLYKDILLWERINKPEKLIKLLQALALQIGNQVSYNELSQLINLDSKTVESYIQLLEKAFIIFRLNSFSRNLRNELKFSKKIYFYDNGIRNALIANYNPVNLRMDIGALWENFIISEKIKSNSYKNIYCNNYFWRTKEQQEIDYIEEMNGDLFAYEFKWNNSKKIKFTTTFTQNYPKAITKVITPKNIEEFIL